jgi:hypothetical protein
LLKRLGRGLRHTLTLASALPAAPKRDLLARMIAFSRGLPQQFNRPLPQMMAHLTPDPALNTLPGTRARNGESTALSEKITGLSPDEIRFLADAVAAWHFRSPLGICLRRSLLRYYFLRQAGLPVGLVFGARLKDSREGGGLGGHAWLTLNGLPYHENPNDYAGFVVMYKYPAD